MSGLKLTHRDPADVIKQWGNSRCVAFTLLYSLLFVHNIQKDPSSTGICMKTVFQDVMGQKARQPALGFIIQSEIPFRVTLFPPEKMVSSVQRGMKEGRQCYFPCYQTPESQ